MQCYGTNRPRESVQYNLDRNHNEYIIFAYLVLKEGGIVVFSPFHSSPFVSQKT